MAVLPEGEHYVGTRGGGMDHAAVTAARRGCALLVGFAPLTLRQIAIPAGWRFLVAHSLTKAEKSGAVKAKYNALRQEGVRALRALDLISYRETLEGSDNLAFAGALGGREQAVFAHVTSEAMRVRSAVIALETGRLEEFGRLLSESHASLRDQLNVSTPAIDALVDAAMDSGASGARLTGAGFGGCVIVLCNDRTIAKVRDGLIARYYSTFAGFHPSLTRFQPSLAGFQPEEDLFEVEASDGALARYGGLANYGALAR
jgi:galactokinase